MKEKESFILYHEEKELFEALSDEQAGQLIKGIFRYEVQEETKLDTVLNLLFIQIKAHLDRNRIKYEEKCKKNKENGSRGGRPRKTERF